jgi:hypothetical protein
VIAVVARKRGAGDAQRRPPCAARRQAAAVASMYAPPA